MSDLQCGAAVAALEMDAFSEMLCTVTTDQAQCAALFTDVWFLCTNVDERMHVYAIIISPSIAT